MRGHTMALAPRQIGEQSELDTFAHLHRCGYTVLICPFRAARYDCVVDIEGELRRVQVKTGYVRPNGHVAFHTRSSNPYRTRRQNSYLDDKEIWFAVWVPKLARLWLVPASECGRREAVLRLGPGGANQYAGRDGALYEVRVPALAADEQSA